MAKRSAGVLLYRRVGEVGLELLLVHPGGPLWRSKDLGAWQLPKGLVEDGEDDETAARREASEELGIALDGPLTLLGEVRQASGKHVVAYAVEHEFDPATLVSNMVEITWPPRSGRTMQVPEVDEARWFAIDEARRYILPSQSPLIDRLVQLASRSGG